MLRFLARRIVVALLVALTVLSISFALTRLSGDLAISIAGPNATTEDITQVRKNYGLDRPLLGRTYRSSATTTCRWPPCPATA
jgi:peptide/nickel transport system permease protein